MPTVQVVKFLHPGPEHYPNRFEKEQGRKEWTLNKHARKFMRSPGCYLTKEASEPLKGEVTFWGEWESPSTFTQFENNAEEQKGMPCYLYNPLAERYEPEPGIKQNTDPYVFGDRFYCSVCRQRAHPFLRTLKPGSLILFGSCLRGHFVLDTVFVVKERLSGWWNAASVSDTVMGRTAREVILKPCCSPSDVDFEKSLYSGAMRCERTSYFSYFPCLPFEKQMQPQRFERPIISFEKGPLTSFRRHGIKWRDNAPTGVAYEDVELDVAHELWVAIRKSVTNEPSGLCLGVFAEEPTLPNPVQ